MKLDNKNILIIGNSRTDKTRNFILPLLNNLDDNKNYVIINQGNITDIAKNKIEEVSNGSVRVLLIINKGADGWLFSYFPGPQNKSI